MSTAAGRNKDVKVRAGTVERKRTSACVKLSSSGKGASNNRGHRLIIQEGNSTLHQHGWQEGECRGEKKGPGRESVFVQEEEKVGVPRHRHVTRVGK